LACLSQRIPLEFNSNMYIAQVNERKQVEGHMCVCLKIDATFESMVTVSASEPLLSEAAYTIMAKTSFNVPKAMKSILEGFAIHKGDHGEFLIMLLFTIACDNAVGPLDQDGLPTQSRIVDVTPFLTQKLFRHRNLKLLHTDFPKAKMHFNHYVKVHEYAAIDAESLLLLSGRGGGILCANSQYMIDEINPFLCHGMTLALGNLGLILWQGMFHQWWLCCTGGGCVTLVVAVELSVVSLEWGGRLIRNVFVCNVCKSLVAVLCWW
jgi:hypothetical protein